MTGITTLCLAHIQNFSIKGEGNTTTDLLGGGMLQIFNRYFLVYIKMGKFNDDVVVPIFGSILE